MKQIHAALLAMTVMAGVGLAAGQYVRREPSPTPLPASEQAAVAKAAIPGKNARYVLGEKDGQLAVYLNEGEEPEIVFHVYLHHLPDVDRARLEEGIEVADYQTLLTLIEDYTS